MTQQQLWKASRASGLSNLTWDEFSSAVISVGNNGGADEPRTPYEGVGAYAATGVTTNGVTLNSNWRNRSA